MKHIRSIGTILALSCAFATGGAWAADASKDQTIYKQVVNDLYKNVAVGPYGIRVKSRNGVVSLTGSVGTARDWQTAEREARGTDGVTEVKNDLSVLIR